MAKQTVRNKFQCNLNDLIYKFPLKDDAYENVIFITAEMLVHPYLLSVAIHN